MQSPTQYPTINMSDIYRHKEPDVITCPGCKSCTWFEQIMVNQFPKMHSVAIGQGIPTASEISFCVLKCIKCGELVEPQVLTGPQDMAQKKYNQFLKEMEDEKTGGEDGETI